MPSCSARSLSAPFVSTLDNCPGLCRRANHLDVGEPLSRGQPHPKGGGHGDQLLLVGPAAGGAAQRPVDPLRQPFGRFGLLLWEHEGVLLEREGHASVAEAHRHHVRWHAGVREDEHWPLLRDATWDPDAQEWTKR